LRYGLLTGLPVLSQSYRTRWYTLKLFEFFMVLKEFWTLDPESEYGQSQSGEWRGGEGERIADDSYRNTISPFLSLLFRPSHDPVASWIMSAKDLRMGIVCFFRYSSMNHCGGGPRVSQTRPGRGTSRDRDGRLLTSKSDQSFTCVVISWSRS
jgi:hypothetical protein